jgi:hypothetical protein
MNKIPPPKVTITVEVLKITDGAVRVRLPSYSNLEVWFPQYYITDMKKNESTGKHTMIVPQWILTSKIESAILKAKKGYQGTHKHRTPVGIRPWKDNPITNNDGDDYAA